MSSAKDKYLDSARKWVVKGQIDRAVKDYEQVVALDPVDMKHRQKLAELLVRMNRKEDAVKEYEAIGNYYADNSFYLKAIAVYKQIQKLIPAEISTTVKLAEFNKKQGLTGNALAEYTTVYSHYSRAGDQKNCLQILEKMIEIDPSNPNILLKFAETRHAAGMREEAYGDYTRLAQVLLKRGDRQAFAGTCDRIRKLFPEKGDLRLEMLAAQVEAGEMSQAIPRLQELIKSDHRNLPAWKLLVKAYERSGNTQELKSVYRYIIHFFPDELFPREALIRCAVDERDFPGGRELVRAHLEWFLAKRLHSVIEGLCEALHDLQPGDETVLAALRDVYQATGNEEKLKEVRARLNPSPAPAPPPPPETPVAAAVPAVPAPAEQAPLPVEDDIWEEEIDLSLVEQLAVGSSVAEGVAAAPAISASGEAASSLVPDDGDEDVVELSAILDDMADGAPGREFEPLADEAPVDRPFTLSDLMRLSGGEFGFPIGEGFGGAQDAAGLAGGEGESLFSEEDLPAFSDFSSALDDLFGDAFDVPPAPTGEAVAEGASFAPGGTVADISSSDSETHYDLGIAYREMGLLDEAIKELQLAGSDPQRTAGCLTLQAVCYRDKGNVGEARRCLQQVLSTGNATAEEKANASYELGLLSEMEGKAAEAARLFQSAQELLPGFRDAAVKAQALGR